MPKLSEKRAKDRKLMAEHLIAAARGAGATAEISLTRDREIWVEIKVAGGARVTVDFDGDSWQPDIHVVTWNMETESDATFSGYMPSVNPFHRRKSGFVAYGFDALLSEINRTIGLLVSGEGYGEPRPCPARANLLACAAEARHAERTPA